MLLPRRAVPGTVCTWLVYFLIVFQTGHACVLYGLEKRRNQHLTCICPVSLWLRHCQPPTQMRHPVILKGFDNELNSLCPRLLRLALLKNYGTENRHMSLRNRDYHCILKSEIFLAKATTCSKKSRVATAPVRLFG